MDLSLFSRYVMDKMAHLLILGYTVILLVGTWAAVTTHQMRRRLAQPFLKSLLYSIVVFNLSVFLYLVGRYVWTNLVRHDPGSADPSVEGVFLLIILLIEIAWAYTVVRLVVELQGEKSLRFLNLVFALLMLMFVIGYPFVWSLNGAGWAVHLVVTTSNAVMIGAWIFLAFRTREPEAVRRNAFRRLGHLMLLGYVPLAASSFLPDPLPTSVSALSRLWLNVVPLLWLRRFFLRDVVPLEAANGDARLEQLVHRHKISKREREIMALILEGKSNKEIEGQLHISFNTVKNHIYNLYQKLGVNSRSQMMHFVMKNEEEHKGRP
jgi:DNA-binding CsgD family transcriptional regulator